MEGDASAISASGGDNEISIHTLRVEGDVVSHDLYFYDISFQSTPSVWRVTNLMIYNEML